jgi:RNA polymerase sigma-70 factor (ECF subfamily)
LKPPSTLPQHVIEDVVQRHQSSVRAFLVYLGAPAGLLDDLVQDVFLSVLSSRFEDRGAASTAAYLRLVARHLFLKAMEKERRRMPMKDLVAAEEAWVEYVRDDEGETYRSALRACLDRINGQAQEVLRLRYEASLAQAEIGLRLGLAESGVHSILVRTKKRLRACIERRLAS